MPKVKKNSAVKSDSTPGKNTSQAEKPADLNSAPVAGDSSSESEVVVSGSMQFALTPAAAATLQASDASPPSGISVSNTEESASGEDKINELQAVKEDIASNATVEANGPENVGSDEAASTSEAKPAISNSGPVVSNGGHSSSENEGIVYAKFLKLSLMSGSH